MNTSFSADELTGLIAPLLEKSQQEETAKLLDELQPYDLALLYGALTEELSGRLLSCLTTGQVADLLEELAPDTQTALLERLGASRSSEAMGMMDNDDLADLLGRLSGEGAGPLLQEMQQEHSGRVQQLLEYPPDTAGGIMTDRFVWILSSFTAREAVEKLKQFASIAESIHYLYVLDQERRLTGVVSYRDLLLASPDDIIGSLMYHRVISVPAYMDQEEAAGIIERYDFVAVPVVDEDNRLLGIITVDDILDVVIREANEDIEKLSASGRDIDFRTKAWVAAGRRLPWLILLLGLGLVSGSIMSFFEGTLQKAVALTFFMPMIAGMTGNTGTQSLAIIVRGLSTNRIDKPTIYRLIAREASVGLIIGAVCGSAVAAAGTLWQGSAALGLIVGSSLFCTLVIGTLAGTVIPLLLFRFRVDPAIASGPLITTLNDIFSLLIYFGIATAFLSRLPLS
jgi:magnesium transporter